MGHSSIADAATGSFRAFGIRERHDFCQEQYCDDASLPRHAISVEVRPNDAVALVTVCAVDSVASMPWESFVPIVGKIVERHSGEEWADA